MLLTRVLRIALAGAAVTAACKDSAGPGQTLVPGVITWIEWPAQVRSTDTDTVLVTASVPCPYRPVYSVTVEDRDVHVTVMGRSLGGSGICPLSGTGAGYDTALALPQLGVGIESLHPVYTVWASVAAGPGYQGMYSSVQREVGTIQVLFAPDTTTDFAGLVLMRQDSLGCWRARPMSEWPSPPWALAEAPALPPTTTWKPAFLIGQLVAGSPAGCGDDRSIDARTLEVDVAPWP